MLCTRRLSLGAALVSVLGLASCLSEPADSGRRPPDARLLLRADLSATTVATLVVEVTAPDISPALLFNIPIVAGAATYVVALLLLRVPGRLGFAVARRRALGEASPGNVR